ncbi:ABC transporter substrate-binding protein [Chelatococcus sp. GCM10030263]|uniref:ABC transporter substrate-binding protein n=1 Tax=Chelatococcus sp. GCM10030263 TaxID=3273387 RepID=UPI003615A67A
MRKLRAACIAGCLMMSSLVTAHAAPPSYYPAEYSQIIEASKKESGLTVYSNIALFNWDPIIAAFRQEYPWIKVEATDLNANEVFERYYADQGAKTHSADILLSAAPLAWLEFLPKNMIEPYQSPEIPHVPAWSVPKPGVYTVSTDPFVLAYNKLLLPEADWPKSMQDIVDVVGKQPAEFDRRLGTYAPNASAFTQAIFWGIVKLRGETAYGWFDKIGPMSDVYRTAGPIVEKITSGEYVIGYLVSSQAVLGLFSDPNREKLIGWALPKDGTVINMRNMAITKTAASPNSAKLMIDFLLSKKGQTAVGKGGLVSFRADVDDPAAMPGGLTYDRMVQQVGEANVSRVALDPEMITGLPKIAPRLEAAFQKK